MNRHVVLDYLAKILEGESVTLVDGEYFNGVPHIVAAELGSSEARALAESVLDGLERDGLKIDRA